MPTKEAFNQISNLVEHFQRNIDSYRSPAYNETQLRIEFVDPFFEALGWDVTNRAGYAEQYKDVIHEDAIKVAGATKAPDYCFRIGGARKFFVETKKPSIDIKEQSSPAYQLRRYAWSAKLPLSILTDFGELAIYDCRLRPKPGDKPSIGRVRLYNCKQYLESFEEIYNLLSKESVLKGSFDKFAQSEKQKRGTTEVDAEFLKEIESWREALAKTIATRNPKLSIRELNFAVQLTIDRIIFLRMCEDRGIEPYGQIQALQNGANTFNRLRQIFYRADDRYNSGLFDFKSDQLTPKLSIDDKPLKDIFKDIYYPESPYEFSVLGADILGHVYEQFLGKVIRLTEGHRAKVEEKPEVRKAGGIYYTPTYIVEYIVKNTVGKLCEGKTPRQISSLRVLDPACGSGSFLLGAYQYLLDYHREWYLKNNPPRYTNEIYQGHRGQWYLTTREKKRILLNNICGVDIDLQAVEVTKLSLLLKVLEGENQDTLERQIKLFKERALPDLGNNIKCGNSLIGPDFYQNKQMNLFDEEEIYRINPFDWEKEFPEIMKKGGFDSVIGNPPYIRIQTMKEWARVEVELYKDHYAAARKGNYDIYVVFVERGLNLLNRQGVLGFILPHKFFNAQYGQPLRGLLSQGKHLAEVVHFGDQQVFVGATNYTCLLFLDKTGKKKCHFVKVNDLTAWRNTGAATDGTVPSSRISACEWNFSVGKSVPLFEKLSKMPVRLGDVAHIFVGLQTSADKIYVLEETAPPKSGLIKIKDQDGVEYLLEREVLKPFLNNLTVSTFEHPVSYHWLIFPYRLTNDKAMLIPASEMASSYPRVWEYLKENSKTLRSRESGRADNDQWYGYIYRKNLTLFDTPKLIVQVISLFGRYAYDDSGLYFSGGGNGPYYGIRCLKSDNPYLLHYFQALLNSRLVDWYLHQISSPFRGGYWSYGKRFLVQLPIRCINFSDPKDRDRHDRMVKLVDQMLLLHKQLPLTKTPDERTRLQRQIDATDQQIDQLVYDLYGLTEKEIQIVEGTLK